MSLTLAMAVTACGGTDTETDTTADAADAADTADETDAADAADTADETDAADAADSEDSTDSADAADETDSSDSEDAEDVGPLYSIEASAAPDVAGTTWHFVGAMLDGEELDAETAQGVLDTNYSGTLDMVFEEDGSASMVQGGGSIDGTYEYVDDYTVLVTLDNNGSELRYACGFVEDEDGVTMVAMTDDRGYDGIYFMQ